MGGLRRLYAALELERQLGADPNVEITLVNRDNFFLFTPILHEVAASDLELTTIVNPLRAFSTKYTSSRAKSKALTFATMN